MSTKIYNAYLLSCNSTRELFTFLQELKTITLKQKGEHILTKIANQINYLMDLSYLYKADKLDILYDDFPKYLTSIYKEVLQSPKAMLRNAYSSSPEPFTCNPTDSNFLNCSIRRLNIESTLHKIEKHNLLQTYSPYNINQSIVFFPPTNELQNQIPCMVFGEELDQLFETACFQPEKLKPEYQTLFQTCQIKDFHYQNQTDKPDDISDSEWNFRKDTWDILLPTGIPSTDGIPVCILDFDIFYWKYNIYYINSDMLQPHFLNCKKEQRCHQLAFNMTESKHMTLIADENQTPYDSINLHNAIRKEIKQKSGLYYETYQTYYQDLYQLLPETLAASEIFKYKVKDLLKPNDIPPTEK